MMGNVLEWTDTATDPKRVLRGGSLNSDASFLDSSGLVEYTPDYTAYVLGFRVASLAVPEPSTYGILGGAAALLGAIALRRRPRRD